MNYFITENNLFFINLYVIYKLWLLLKNIIIIKETIFCLLIYKLVSDYFYKSYINYILSLLLKKNNAQIKKNDSKIKSICRKKTINYQNVKSNVGTDAN